MVTAGWDTVMLNLALNRGDMGCMVPKHEQSPKRKKRKDR